MRRMNGPNRSFATILIGDQSMVSGTLAVGGDDGWKPHPRYEERPLRSFPRRLRVAVAILGLASVGMPVMGRISSAEDGLKVGSLRVGKILFLGNSITFHGPAKDIGWTGDWGMAATAREKDYVHRLVDRISREAGGVPKVMIRNIAGFERKPTDFTIREALKQELTFEADVVILAIGENSQSPKTDEDRNRFADGLRYLLAELGQHGHPKFFVRSEFWPDAEKDRLLKKACDNAGGIFIDLGKIAIDPTNSARSERNIEHAGVAGHPGDKGMAAIADELWRAMRKAGESRHEGVIACIAGKPGQSDDVLNNRYGYPRTPTRRPDPVDRRPARRGRPAHPHRADRRRRRRGLRGSPGNECTGPRYDGV
jgi:hypothetical protein